MTACRPRLPLPIGVLFAGVALLTGTERELAVRFTGRYLRVNGREAVPLGLFGVHAVRLTPELVDDLGVECARGIHFVPGGGSKLVDHKRRRLDPVRAALPVYIDCQGDRFYPPLQLTRENWRDYCERIGRAYGELSRRLAAEIGRHRIVQWWNEPYLNWAERSAGERGSTINQRYYDLERAVEGGPVHLAGREEPLRHFRWRGTWPVRYVEKQNKQGKKTRKMIVGWSVEIPEGLGVGDTFEAAENRYWRQPGKVKTWTVEKHWFPVDPTARFFWSGRQNLDFYRQMFGPWARALRRADPEATILAGWDFNYSAGGWSVWTELYRPLLAEFPELVDGCTEHHYGIAPGRVHAWYEVGTADAWAITGRFLRHWNTECQGRLDPAVHGGAGHGAAEGLAGKLHEAIYSAADIIGAVARVPDKAASRTVHNWYYGREGGFGASGAAWALRLLKDLRGRLLHLEVPRELWAAGARRADGRVVLACFNPGAPARVTVDAAALGLASGQGNKKTEALDLRRLEAGEDDLAIATTPLALADGAVAFDLPHRGAGLLVVPRPRVAGTVERRQFFPAEGALLAGTGEAIEIGIEIPEAALENAEAARLRAVIEAEAEEPIGFRIGGRELALPASGGIAEKALPLAALTPGVNAVVVALPDGARLCTASIYVDRASAGGD